MFHFLVLEITSDSPHFLCTFVYFHSPLLHDGLHHARVCVHVYTSGPLHGQSPVPLAFRAVSLWAWEFFAGKRAEDGGLDLVQSAPKKHTQR